MGRSKTYYFGILNIKEPKHKTENYINLIFDAHKLEKVIKIRANDYGLLGSCNFINGEKKEEGIHGTILKFFNLDPQTDWLNILKREEATDDERSNIRIPDYLKPNYEKFVFVFKPKSHRLFVLTNNEKGKSMSIGTAQKFFSRLFNSDELMEEYGEIEVIIEQDKEEFIKLMNSYKISHLEIMVSQPNVDHLEGEDDEVRKRLEDQNAKSLIYQLKSKNNETILPNEDTMKLARVATSNGYVKITGKDEEEKTIVKSTIEYPKIESMKIDESKEEFFSKLFEKVQQILISLV